MASPGHVVLIHAFPLNATLWSGQRQAVPPRWQLFTPDLPGFGSATVAPASSVDAMAAAVLSSMDDAGIERAVIGGMSMGGYVTFALLRRAPERVAGLILIDTRATADTEEQRQNRSRMIAMVEEHGSSAVADDMLPKLLGATTQRERPELSARVRAMIESNRPDTIAAAVQAMKDRPDATSLLAEVRVPALILCGEEDRLTPPADSEALHQGMRGSRLVLIPRAGHLASLERPDAFNAAFTTFLESIP